MKKRHESVPEKVRRAIRQYHMADRGDRIMCGVSGGADSVCLLHCLRILQEEAGFALFAVHVHHGIRGREADEDEAFVKALCETMQIPFISYHCDVPSYAKEHRLTEEEAGRTLRYLFFADAAEKISKEETENKGTVRVALAHHMDDAAETVLFQLSRGSGLAGLAGIRPVSERDSLTLIRPLLAVRREEIEAFLAGQGVAYRTDGTNLTDEYARNRIRHHVMPYLEKEIHAGAVRHFAENALLAGEALDFIEEEARRRFSLYEEETEGPEGFGGVFLPERAYRNESPFLFSYMIRHALSLTAPHQQNISRGHIEAVRALFEKGAGRKIDLPGGITVTREYEGCRFRRRAGEAPGEADLPRYAPQPLREGESVSFGDWLFTAEKDSEIRLPIPENTYTKWIDFAIITDDLCVRTRKKGDFITVRPDGAAKSLKKYMIDAKIPSRVRDEIPLIADGREIVWIAGERLSERYKITTETKAILKITMTKKENGQEKTHE